MVIGVVLNLLLVMIRIKKNQLLPRKLIILRLLPLLLILTTIRTENNLHIQLKRIIVVLGLSLIMYAVLPTVIMKTLLKVALLVVVLNLNTVRLLTVLPVDLVTVDMTFMIFQMNSITPVPLTLV